MAISIQNRDSMYSPDAQTISTRPIRGRDVYICEYEEHGQTNVTGVEC